MMRTIINPIQKCAFVAKEGFELIVNLTQLGLCAESLRDNRLIRRDDGSITRVVQPPDCRGNSREELQSLGGCELIDISHQCSVTVENRRLLRHGEGAGGDE